MYKLTNKEWEALPLLDKPYAYDYKTETAFTKKEYKKWKKGK